MENAPQYVIEMLHITKEFPGIRANDDITLQLRKGEIHALLGENGAGKSTLMSILFGMYQPDAGEIRKDGKPVTIQNPNDAPLQQVGNVTVPEARVLMIQPWESKLIKDIEKAILASDIGITPTNDGKSIRLVFPELTEERRKELAKDVKKKGDAAKTAVRNIRRDGNDAFKKSNKAKEISEDEYAELQEKLQKITDKYVAMVDKAVEAKTKEIMTV